MGGPISISITSRLFYGRIRQRIMPDGGSSRSSIHEKEDLFSHLPVNVSEEGIDIYDGLSRYFNDTVEFEGKKAHMEVSLVDLPPILQIQLQVSMSSIWLRSELTQAYNRGCSLIVNNFKRSSHRHTSNSEKQYPWIVFWRTPIRRRSDDRMKFRQS